MVVLVINIDPIIIAAIITSLTAIVVAFKNDIRIVLIKVFAAHGPYKRSIPGLLRDLPRNKNHNINLKELLISFLKNMSISDDHSIG